MVTVLAMLSSAALAAAVATSSPTAVADRAAGSCGFFGKAGVDYQDANLSVISVGGGHPYEACCAACDSWNAQKHSQNCTIGVVYNAGTQRHPSAPAPCALKASSLRPVPGRKVTAVSPIPASPPGPPPAPPRPPSPVPPVDTFRFASIFGDGMVLQMEPSVAMVWGFCQSGAAVSVTFGGKTMDATVTGTSWTIKLPPVPGSMTIEHNIAATSAGITISLRSILFGDIYVCGGQSK